MAELLTIQDSIDGRLDTQTLKEAVNEDKLIKSRLGKEYASVPMASRLLVENGLLGATPFSTYTAMTASALVNGDYAVVTNDPVQVNNGIYEMRDGEWIKSRYNIPLFSYLLAERDEAHGETGLVIEFADAEGKVFFGFDEQGRCHADVVLGDILSENNETHVGGAVVSLTDDDGSFVAGFDSDGTLIVNSLRVLNEEPVIEKYKQKIEFIHEGGQSNSIGGGAANLAVGEKTFTLVNPHPENCLMFNSGARGAMSNSVTEAELSSFVSIVEVAEDGRGETHGSGITFSLFEKNFARNLPDKKYVYRSNGRGGTAIVDLLKGSSYPMYANGIAEVQAAVDIAAEDDNEIVMRAFFWTQGEQDRADNVTRADYATMLNQYISDYRTDVSALLPDSNPELYCIINQLCVNKGGSTRNLIHLAQYDVMVSNPFCTIATPTYHLAFGAQEGVHFTPLSNAITGEYMAKAYHSLERGFEWNPVHPTSFTVSANEILIDFYTPCGALQFNLSHRIKANNYGFEYSDDASNTIVDVELINASQVKITLSAAPAANAVIGYAVKDGVNNETLDSPYSGVWGNLSDSDTTQSINDPNFTLANYCVSFDHAIN